MERLSDEVLQVVKQVHEKNEEIGRLTAMLEEHKVRERALMNELKRHGDGEYDGSSDDHEEIVEEETVYSEVRTKK